MDFIFKAAATTALSFATLMPVTAPPVVEVPKPVHDLVVEVRVDAIIQKLIDCESRGRNIKIVDSNGYYSYGILQFQKSTWDDFSKQSGIRGDPMNKNDSIKMARWAIMNGYAKRWTCWKSVPKEMRQLSE